MSRQHYDANDEEKKILVPAIPIYFSYQPRSDERNNIISQLLDKLQKINPDHWNTTNVRVWLRNNQKNFPQLSQGMEMQPLLPPTLEPTPKFVQLPNAPPLPPITNPPSLLDDIPISSNSNSLIPPPGNSSLLNDTKSQPKELSVTFPPRTPSRPFSPLDLFSFSRSSTPSIFDSSPQFLDINACPPKKNGIFNSDSREFSRQSSTPIENKKLDVFTPLDLKIPDIPDRLMGNQFDAFKNEMFSLLKKLLAAISRLSIVENSTSKQEEQLNHEKYMNQIIEIFTNTLSIKKIHCKDDESSYITPATLETIKEDKLFIKTQQTIPKNISAKLIALYQGTAHIEVRPIENYLCSDFSRSTLCVLTNTNSVTEVFCLGRSFKLSSSPVKSITLDENDTRLWINYGNSVCSYKLQNIRDQKEGQIGAASEYEIQIPNVEGRICNIFDFVFTLSGGQIVRTNLSNSTPPSKFDIKFNDNPLKKPDFLATHSNRLFVASKDYHTVYVLDFNLQIIERLVGHTGNVNLLLCANGFLFVGSTDQYVRVYDAEHLSLITTIDTTDFTPVSATGGKINEFPVVFLGGCSNNRCSVRVYDVNQKSFISEIFTESQIPAHINFESEDFTLEIICQSFERKGDIISIPQTTQIANNYCISYFVTKTF